MKCEFCDRHAQYRDLITGEYVCPVHARVQVVGWRGAPPHPHHTICPASDSDYGHVQRLAEYFWGETQVTCFGQSYDLARLPALLAWVQPTSELEGSEGEDLAKTGVSPGYTPSGGRLVPAMVPVGLLSYALEEGRLVIVLLNVRPQYQGMGIAGQLLQRTCELARESGRPRVVVATSNDDLPALSLYQRHGFHLAGLWPERILAHHGREETGFAGIPVRDEVHLALDLAPATPLHRGPSSKRRKVGLALSGGAGRGMAHLGAIEVLEEAGIRPDFVAGVSAGAVAGALYCAGVPLDELMEETRNLQWTEVGRIVRPQLGFFNIDRLAEYLDERFLHGKAFDQLDTPFAALAVDLLTGEEVVLDHGQVSWAVRTSCSLPGAFTPVVQGERILVDGGLANNVPVKLARDMGADYVIAVDLLPPSGQFKAPHNIFEMWSMTFYRLRRATHGESEEADCVIFPSVGRMSMIDFSLADKFIELGRQAAREQIDRMRVDLGL
jgi:NTE family protein